MNLQSILAKFIDILEVTGVLNSIKFKLYDTRHQCYVYLIFYSAVNVVTVIHFFL